MFLTSSATPWLYGRVGRHGKVLHLRTDLGSASAEDVGVCGREVNRVLTVSGGARVCGVCVDRRHANAITTRVGCVAKYVSDVAVARSQAEGFLDRGEAAKAGRCIRSHGDALVRLQVCALHLVPADLAEVTLRRLKAAHRDLRARMRALDETGAARPGE